MNDLLMQADLKDLVSPKLEKIKKNVGDVGKSSNILQGAFGDLTNKAESMGVPLGKMESYFGKINPLMLGGVAAVGAVAVGLGALAMNAVKVGADLQDMSDTTGLSVESLSSMRNVLAASNMDTKGYADGISKLSIKLGENGAAFKKLGIDTQDPEKAFDQIKHKIGDMTNPLEKAQFANKAFGKSFKDMMPLLTMANDEYDKMKGNTTVFSSEFAANAAKVDDNIALLKTTFADFGVQLGANFIPLMTSLVGILQEAADFWGNMAKGPDKQVKRAADMDAIKKQYDGVQEESDKGSKVLGQSNHRVKINGKTLFEALQEYQSKVRAEDKLEAERLAKEKAEREAKLKATGIMDSFGSDGKKKKSDLTPEEQVRQTDNFRLNGLEINSKFSQQKKYEDEQTKIETDRGNQALGEEKRILEGRLKLQKDYEKSVEEIQSKMVQHQVEVLNSITGNVSSALVKPMDDFFKRVGSGNKSMSDSFYDLFTDIGDNFGNMLSSMLSQLVAKAAIFGMLNLMSGGGMGAATTALKSFSFLPSFDVGSPNIGYDQIARIHKGEAIIPAKEASEMRSGNYGPASRFLGHSSNQNSNSSYSVNVYGSNLGVKDITQAVTGSLKTIEKRNSYRRSA